ncbi:hypothetical protein K525DRAFT_366527 [Schizophyllum commune Loenen D]|nr:hypothetical protein K525DRAFT_366527 [Schizophyllum commune Loenen D]
MNTRLLLLALRFSSDSDAETTDDDGAELSAYENVDGDDHPRGSSRPSYAYETRPHAPDTLPEQSTWYQFDTAVLVALASCLGNFLTGGDHLKNILLAGLLVFYLHQVIEVPWRLYLQARPRVPHAQHTQDNSGHRPSASAATTLRRRELTLLAFAVLSPFLGVTLLTRVTTAATGDPHALSWFSRTLFVLAAGIRPWRHLSERLSSDIDALHTAVHYPPKHRGVDVEKEIAELRHAVSRIEHALVRLNDRSQEVSEYVDDALDVVERRVRRQERRLEKREKAAARAETVFVEAPKRASPSLASYLLPWWMMQYGSGGAQGSAGGGVGNAIQASSPARGKKPVNRAVTLETIPEEGVLAPSPARRPVPPTTGSALSQLLTLPLRIGLRLLGLG